MAYFECIFIVGEGTLPWAIFRTFSNYSQKFEKIKMTVWRSDKNIKILKNVCEIFL